MPAWTLRDIEPVIRASWAEDTCDPVDLPWSHDNPSRGQCGVTALVLHDLLGGELLCADVRYADGTRQGWHYWNRLSDGVEVDLTREQFATTELVQAPVVVAPPQETPWRCAEQYFLLKARVLTHLDRSGSADRDELIDPDH